MKLIEHPGDPLHTPQSSTELSTGVYLLFLDKTLVYVGRSGNCPRRIADHRSNGRPFDFSLILPCWPDEAEWVERALIHATEAVQNRMMFSTYKAKALVSPQRAAMQPAEHPLMLFNKGAARKKVKAFGLSREFGAACRAGNLPFRLKNPEAKSATAERVVTLGALIAWCERAQAAKGLL